MNMFQKMEWFRPRLLALIFSLSISLGTARTQADAFSPLSAPAPAAHNSPPPPIPANDLAICAYAVVSENPTAITLKWGLPTNHNSLTYSIYRKGIFDTSWGTPIATLTDTDTTANTSYTDTNVKIGQGYEYQLSRSDGTYGFIYAGIEVSATESRGQIILLIDSTKSADLAVQLAQLQSDLVGDGWTVLRHDIDPTMSVPSVKAIIKNDYTTKTNVQALLLFGHIPVPYSGTFAPQLPPNGGPPVVSHAPDGHLNHNGAWPADVYYGDMTGTYTDIADTTVTLPGQPAPSFANLLDVNKPGDGKFDQDHIPSDGSVVLQIGRVDLSALTQDPTTNPKGSFTDNETTLLANYLAKDHHYRFNHAPFNAVPAKSLFGHQYGRPNFEFKYAGPLMFQSTFGGPDGADPSPVITSWLPNPLNTTSYLWAFGIVSGNWDHIDDLVTTDLLAHNNYDAVFTQLFGSFSGDWNYPNDVVRATIATKGTSLGCVWGFDTYFHHMSLGETIGYGLRVMQNDGSKLYPAALHRGHGIYSDYRLGAVWLDLQGDPTLRLFPVVPPSDLTVTTSNASSTLKWTASTDSPLRGYYVYRSSDANGPFTRLNPNPVTDTQYVDASPLRGLSYYMVRAIKFQTTFSGTYLNPSQGIFAQAKFGQP